jgi:hypothetical protein
MVEVKGFSNIKIQNFSTIKNYLFSAMVKANCFFTRLRRVGRCSMCWKKYIDGFLRTLGVTESSKTGELISLRCAARWVEAFLKNLRCAETFRGRSSRQLDEQWESGSH